MTRDDDVKKERRRSAFRPFRRPSAPPRCQARYHVQPCSALPALLLSVSFLLAIAALLVMAAQLLQFILRIRPFAALYQRVRPYAMPHTEPGPPRKCSRPSRSRSPPCCLHMPCQTVLALTMRRYVLLVPPCLESRHYSSFSAETGGLDNSIFSTSISTRGMLEKTWLLSAHQSLSTHPRHPHDLITSNQPKHLTSPPIRSPQPPSISSCPSEGKLTARVRCVK